MSAPVSGSSSPAAVAVSVSSPMPALPPPPPPPRVVADGLAQLAAAQEASGRAVMRLQRCASGHSLPGRLVDRKLKRTNLMRRRESQVGDC